MKHRVKQVPIIRRTRVLRIEAITKILYNHDPIGLIPMMPDNPDKENEYKGEAEQIAYLLWEEGREDASSYLKTPTVRHVKKLCWQIFAKSFCTGTAVKYKDGKPASERPYSWPIEKCKRWIGEEKDYHKIAKDIVKLYEEDVRL